MANIDKTSVSLTNKTKTCSNSCSLKHDYGISSCHIQKLDDYINIIVDGKNKVTFNNSEYTLQHVRLYKGSWYNFANKNKPKYSLVLHHSGDGKLTLVIPIKVASLVGSVFGTSVNKRSQLFFNQFASQITNSNEKKVVNVVNWSLDSIIPTNTPFWTFNVSKDPSIQKRVVVFDVDYPMAISSADVNYLKKAELKEQRPGNVKTKMDVEYNKLGFEGFSNREGFTSMREGMEDMKNFDCIPVEIDGEPVDEKTGIAYDDKKDLPGGIPWHKILDNPFIIIIIATLILMAVYFVVIPGVITLIAGDEHYTMYEIWQMS